MRSFQSIDLRPFTCAHPVMPGRTVNIFLWLGVYWEIGQGW
jgi:hypothetical protein